MKKIISVLIMMFFTFLNVHNLNADCGNVINEALNVYEDVWELNNYEITTVRMNYRFFTENLYAVVANDYNEEVKTYYFDDMKNGVLTFDTHNPNKNIKYIVKVYSKDTACGTDALRTFTFTTPKYNPYSIATICNNSYEIDLCRAFYDVKDMTYEEFLEKVEAKIEEEKDKESLTFEEIITEYYMFILIPILVISAIYIVKIVLLKRRKKNV